MKEKYENLNREHYLEGAKDCPFCGNDYIKTSLEVRILDDIKWCVLLTTCNSCDTSQVKDIELQENTEYKHLLSIALARWNARYIWGGNKNDH